LPEISRWGLDMVLEQFSGWRTESRTVNGELKTVNGYPI
jgi:hypothetical protein